MIKVYPVILTPSKDGGFCVNIPDFNAATQGEDIADAIYMARDAIGLLGITLEDDKKPIPEPCKLSDVKIYDEENGILGNDQSIVTLIDIDFAEYRNKCNDVGRNNEEK